MNRLLLSALAVLLIAGCGVPVDAQPHVVPLPTRSGQQTPGHTATAGTTTQMLYMVKDGLLFPIQRGLPAQADATEILSALLAGPTAQERESGLSSALLGSEIGLTVHIRDSQAIVELAAGLEGTGRTDDILAFAQIVCTLTSSSGINTVIFTRSGEQAEVPRADSSLTRAPLTFADYASLIANR